MTDHYKELQALLEKIEEEEGGQSVALLLTFELMSLVDIYEPDGVFECKNYKGDWVGVQLSREKKEVH